MTEVQYDTIAGGVSLAFREDGGGHDLGRCGFFWLGGFKSDMMGSKAEALAALARDTRRPSFRFDYSGHGQSHGQFTDGTMTNWLDETVHMFRRRAVGRRIVVGSSMGGWLALLLLKALRSKDPAAARRIAGLVLIAPAADMTADLMWQVFPPNVRRDIAEKGVYLRPSPYGSPYEITAKLISDGDHHLVLKDGLDCDCPVRILQGDRDDDVPSAHAAKVFEALRGADVTLTLVKGGDHRLSSPSQLTLIRETVLRLAERADGITV